MQLEKNGSSSENRSVVLASPRGFCAGVDLAIGIVELAVNDTVRRFM